MHWILSWAQVLVCRLYEFTFDPRTWISKLVVVGRSQTGKPAEVWHGQRVEAPGGSGGRFEPTWW